VRFSPELRDDVASGDITVSIRLWSRPKAKVGGRYDVGPSASRLTRSSWFRFRA